MTLGCDVHVSSRNQIYYSYVHHIPMKLDCFYLDITWTNILVMNVATSTQKMTWVPVMQLHWILTVSFETTHIKSNGPLCLSLAYWSTSSLMIMTFTQMVSSKPMFSIFSYLLALSTIFCLLNHTLFQSTRYRILNNVLHQNTVLWKRAQKIMFDGANSTCSINGKLLDSKSHGVF